MIHTVNTHISPIPYAEFFKIVYATSSPDMYLELRYVLEKDFSEGRIYRLWEKKKNMTKWVCKIEELERQIPHNIHFAIAPRIHKSGKKTAVGEIPALWLDVDNVSLEEAVETYATSLSRLGILPNLWVSSGYGTYLFWLFTKPSQEFNQCEEANRTLAWLIDGGDTQSAEYAHSLRAPGSYNCKTSIPKPVQSYVCHTTRYDSSSLLKKLSVFKSEIESEVQKTQIYIPSTQKTLPVLRRRKYTPLSLPSMKQLMAVPCPLIHQALYAPSDLSYTGWLSIGGACRTVYAPSDGARLFHAISKLDTIRYKEQETERIWRYIEQKGMLPWGCHKVMEGEQCPHKNICHGLLSVLRKVHTLK